MYRLRKKFTFEAAHQLAHHDGKCARLHGHSWTLVIELAGKELHGEGPQRGMLMDYGLISRDVKPLVEDLLDHHHLNETLQSDDTTSEFVASWVWGYLRGAHLGMDPVEWIDLLAAIEVHETCTAACRLEVRDA